MSDEPLASYELDSARLNELDDCWNRIGVRGDHSCERLTAYIHCRNCPVHENAATQVLDRVHVLDIASQAPFMHAGSDETRSERDAGTQSHLVFRIGDEWLALPTAVFLEVAQLRRIHSLPHRRHRAVLGVVNVRGALLVCVSLARLFGIESQPQPQPQAAGAATSGGDARGLGRMLVVRPPRGDAAAIVFPVDAVDGVRRFSHAEFQPVPATLAQASASHAHAVVTARGTTVGLLDADKLLDTLDGSLT
jgi:chemotaxis-related protein WspD